MMVWWCELFVECWERKAEIEDPTVVLEAAARFLEARARSIGEVRRRLTTTGYRADLIEDAIVRREIWRQDFAE